MSESKKHVFLFSSPPSHIQRPDIAPPPPAPPYLLRRLDVQIKLLLVMENLFPVSSIISTAVGFFPLRFNSSTAAHGVSPPIELNPTSSTSGNSGNSKWLQSSAASQRNRHRCKFLSPRNGASPNSAHPSPSRETTRQQPSSPITIGYPAPSPPPDLISASSAVSVAGSAQHRPHIPQALHRLLQHLPRRPASRPSSATSPISSVSTLPAADYPARSRGPDLDSHSDEIRDLRAIKEVIVEFDYFTEAIAIVDRLTLLAPDTTDLPLIRAYLQSYSGKSYSGNTDSAKQGFEALLAQNTFLIEAYHGLVMTTSQTDEGERENILRRVESAMEACQKEKPEEDVRNFKLLLEAQIRAIEGKYEVALKVY